MKFRHSFKLVDFGESHREYICDDTKARLDFVGDGIVRVAIYKDSSTLLPTVCINPCDKPNSSPRPRLSLDGFSLERPKVVANEMGETITLSNGVNIKVNLNNFLLAFEKNGEVLFRDRAPLAYNFENEFGGEMCHYISREKGERIFGIGDKTGYMNKAGRSFRIETTDCMGYDAESSDPLYKHIPFYICENSVGVYGLFYDTSATSYMDFGTEINNYYEPFKFFKTQDNCLVYYVFIGSKLEVLQRFSSICGKQAFPPKWSFDYCASTMAYTDAPNSNEEMNGFLDKVRELDLSCSGFYLSSGYTSIGNQRCVFHWNKDKFPSPEDFVKKFNDNNIHIIPNIKPAFLESHPMYDDLCQRGLFVKNADGTPFVTQFWDGLGSYLDFTKKEAYEFWQDQVDKKLLSLGMDATWNDNNEFDIRDNEALAEGFGDGKVKACDIRPMLTYLMVKASYEAQIKKDSVRRPFLSTRSGNIALRRLAQTWTGDNMTSWHDLYFCHYVGLNLSLSGMFLYGHDLGGFSGDMPSKELLLRWIQHGIFEPRFTIHSWNNNGTATMPWSYEDVNDAVREIFSQRKVLAPYMYSSAYNSVQNDVPMNAPLFLYYDDENLDLDCQSFLVGRDLLATCILEQGKERVNAYLPKGDNWYLGDKIYEGGAQVELNIPSTSKVPYFIRSGCVFPTDEGEYGFESEEKLVFTVYPVERGSFKSSFFTDDGETNSYKDNDCVKLEFDVCCDEAQVVVTVNNLGKQKMTPDLSLVPNDNRKLII